jgi:hypothetical protein
MRNSIRFPHRLTDSTVAPTRLRTSPCLTHAGSVTVTAVTVLPASAQFSWSEMT